MMKLKKPITKKRAVYRWFTEKFLEKNPSIYEKIHSMLENTNHNTWLKIYKLFVHHEDDDESIKKISTNTLVITGRDDIGSKPKMSEEISKLIPGSQCKIVEKGRHLCNIECAKDFNVTIKKFIQNNDKA